MSNEGRNINDSTPSLLDSGIDNLDSSPVIRYSRLLWGRADAAWRRLLGSAVAGRLAVAAALAPAAARRPGGTRRERRMEWAGWRPQARGRQRRRGEGVGEGRRKGWKEQESAPGFRQGAEVSEGRGRTQRISRSGGQRTGSRSSAEGGNTLSPPPRAATSAAASMGQHAAVAAAILAVAAVAARWQQRERRPQLERERRRCGGGITPSDRTSGALAVAVTGSMAAAGGEVGGTAVAEWRGRAARARGSNARPREGRSETVNRRASRRGPRGLAWFLWFTAAHELLGGDGRLRRHGGTLRPPEGRADPARLVGACESQGEGCAALLDKANAVVRTQDAPTLYPLLGQPRVIDFFIVDKRP